MSQRPMKAVLVVEDDTDLAEVLSIVLASAGYDTVTASDGREALDRMRTVRPRVILLDLMMPGMNGWEFRSAQLRDPALADLPVIVMTGDGNAKAKAESLAASGCLQKPIDMTQLLRTVGEHA